MKRSTLPRNTPMRGSCALTHTVPRVQARPNAFPQRPFPHLLQNLGTLHSCRPLQSKRRSTRRFEPVTNLKNGFSKHFNALSKAIIGSLRCSSHSSSRVLFLPMMLSLRAGSQYSSSLSLAAFIAQRAFAFLALTWLFGSCCTAHLSVVTVQLFPFFANNSFVNCLAEGMPDRINQRRPPSVVLNVVNIAVPTSSARNVNSSAPSLMAAFWVVLTEIRLGPWLCAFTQMTHVHRTMLSASNHPFLLLELLNCLKFIFGLTTSQHCNCPMQ